MAMEMIKSIKIYRNVHYGNIDYSNYNYDIFCTFVKEENELFDCKIKSMI